MLRSSFNCVKVLSLCKVLWMTTSTPIYFFIGMASYMYIYLDQPKGQLISKCAIVWTKIPTKKFDKFCPTHSRAESVNFFRWYFGSNDDTKRTFWNWLTFNSYHAMPDSNSISNSASSCVELKIAVASISDKKQENI